MRKLQDEHAEWLSRKYPDQTPKIPAVGCVEEAGELVHAVLKAEQVRVWGETDRHKLAELRVKLVDAVGDCGIYACSLCNANGWDFESLWNNSRGYADDDPALDAAIVLVQAAAYVALDPVNLAALSNYVSQLKTVANSLGLDATACMVRAWEEVRCR